MAAMWIPGLLSTHKVRVKLEEPPQPAAQVLMLLMHSPVHGSKQSELNASWPPNLLGVRGELSRWATSRRGVVPCDLHVQYAEGILASVGEQLSLASEPHVNFSLMSRYTALCCSSLPLLQKKPLWQPGSCVKPCAGVAGTSDDFVPKSNQQPPRGGCGSPNGDSDLISYLSSSSRIMCYSTIGKAGDSNGCTACDGA